MAAIAASGEDAIKTTIDVDLDTTASTQDFEDFYEIDRTVADIEEGDYKRVAMQFPDNLLHDSVPIFRALKRKLSLHRELYVLADTSYGRQDTRFSRFCCVDEVAASHVDADAVVHYGYACMSQSPRIPVIYVFGKKPIDIEDCVSKFKETLLGLERSEEQRPVVLRHDVGYNHQAAVITECLREALAPHHIQVFYAQVPHKVLPSSPAPAATSTSDRSSSSSSPSSQKPTLNHPIYPENCSILYIGEESLGLTHLLMTHSSSVHDVISYSPSTRCCRVESASPSANKLLMRRYAVIQKARDADVFGILVGTLGGASYLPLIHHLRALLKKRNKKFYTISVGKLNPSKLANFMEIECFVLVACPENSLVDAKEFFRPIVTPYELEVALANDPAEAWLSSSETTGARAGGGYILDFQKLLIGGERDSQLVGKDSVVKKEGVSGDGEEQGREGINDSEDGVGDGDADEDEDEDRPVFSLVTGKYRHPKRFGGANDKEKMKTTEGEGKTLIRTQQGTLAVIEDSAAGTYLREQRIYQGLDPRLGQDAPSTLEQGRSGIARGYGEAGPGP
ncbi:diphthamide biosynthesis protein [Dendrothele bispora CBS 962.96]|uniref:2-(3-amino-3-carboxypropyl)histidine synthase subunit 2 n=1 Tax=Dendrothele bispora (strain CBS 962.96) TaxID=1314807 RepID=A0A4S8KPK7_DENBC|nr:diphthamide biosynthesis protein [Dendrothele bispora CBS 962.96]